MREGSECVCWEIYEKRKNKKENLSVDNCGPVWYVYLKTENCCLKIFVKIRVNEKVY